MHNNMERVYVFNNFNIIIVAALTLLAPVPKTESQMRGPPVVPRPLCASQLALVNYACGRLPFSPGAPPTTLTSPPSPPPSPDHQHDNHGHGRRGGDHNRHGGHSSHRHHHHDHHHESFPDEENCCRWAKDMDTQCVCDLLVHLPPFLVRPAHQYTLIVGDECEVTYSCGGPI